MTVKDWVQSAKHQLSQAGFESAGLEVQLLAAHVLLVDRPWLMAHPDEPFPEFAGESLLNRRLAHEPLAYILGWREFYGRRFAVRPGVLIPRQETEVLVETALKWIDKSGSAQPTVLDLATGSGCIAITLKLERPDWIVTASDNSSAAIEIASSNGEDLKADVTFVYSNLFEDLKGEAFQAIVTNPPYIGTTEPLAKQVADYEPHGALFAGETGLEFYERLSQQAGPYLTPGGILLMEVGYRQAEVVASLVISSGWRVEEVVSDLSGIERVVVCTK